MKSWLPSRSGRWWLKGPRGEGSSEAMPLSSALQMWTAVCLFRFGCCVRSTKPELIHSCTRVLYNLPFDSSKNFSVTPSRSTRLPSRAGTEVLALEQSALRFPAAIMNVLLSPQPPLFPHHHDAARPPPPAPCTHTRGSSLSCSLLMIVLLSRRSFLFYHE